ncbi:MAG: hypothetical protein GY769_01175 [bacterium]|nr:hypothetical protein [bacterium]
MFRTRAVRQLLLEDIAGVRRHPEPEDSVAALERARRRALLVVVFDWIAILILVFVRARSGEMFSIGPSEDSIFSLGLLAIAAHSGFRLGQLEKIRAVARALDELEERSQPVTEPPSR